MSFPRWLSSVPRRSRSKQPARRRSANPTSSIQTWMLEERILLSRGHGVGGGSGDVPPQTTVYVAPTKAGEKLSGHTRCRIRPRIQAA